MFLKYWRRALLAVVVIIVGIVGYYLWNKDKAYIVMKDPYYRIEIPKDIVKSKDCKKFREWFDTNYPPVLGLIPVVNCPWAAKPKSSIGEFIVNGVKFWIPRDYLWPNKMLPDGEDDVILMLMIYPEMSTSYDVKNNNELILKIHTTKNWKACQEKGYCDASQDEYEFSLGLTYMDKNKRKEYLKTYPKKIKYLHDLDLTIYKKKNNSDEFYVRGNKYRPNYWLKCDTGSENKNYNPGCYSTFNLDNRFYIEYSFRKTALLKHHDEIRAKIIEKLKEWQQAPKSK
jgi:hypothetical protein